jgi:hypothetical protein
LSRKVNYCPAINIGMYLYETKGSMLEYFAIGMHFIAIRGHIATFLIVITYLYIYVTLVVFLKFSIQHQIAASFYGTCH